MTNGIFLSGSHLLTKNHQVDAFDCGVPALNDYLKRAALEAQLSQGARSYVVTRGNDVVGYFTLAYGSVSSEEAPVRVQQGLGRYPVPVLILARLAVALNEKGQGLGKALLKQALLKATQASEIAGLRAVLVHAKGDESKAFYQQYGFLPFPSNELTLYLLIKDIQKNLSVVHKEIAEVTA